MSVPVQPNVINRLLGGPLGALILKPWYDPVALQAIVQFYMPASRAWAEANAAAGDVDAFIKAVGKPRVAGLGLIGVVSETALRHHAYCAAETAWQSAALGGAKPADLAYLEGQRMAAADKWMHARRLFLAPHLTSGFDPVKFAIQSRSQVDQRHGERLTDPAKMFPSPDDTRDITQSATCDVHGRRLSWARFPAAPHSGDTHGWARIEEPRDGNASGVVIFCHGILMEREHWASLYDQAQVFLEPEGGALAVISPEGPSHGRRMQSGFYGGEPVLAHGVGGMADYFAAHVVEVGRLIAWARQKYGVPVAVAGVSLGALTAQLVVSAAKHWPADCKPDAALLLTTNESLMEVTYNGDLARALNLPTVLETAGWTPEMVEHYRPLMEPGAPAVPPERVFCVLGDTDTVTPYAGGQRLVGRWELPESNVFTWHGGHFAAAFSVLRDRTPIHRFKAALAATKTHASI